MLFSLPGLLPQIAPWAVEAPSAPDAPVADDDEALAVSARPRGPSWWPRVALRFTRRGHAVALYDLAGRPFAPSVPWGTALTVQLSWGPRPTYSPGVWE
jgi:hypothetical protein